MIRRLVTAALVLVVAGAGALAFITGGEEPPRYEIVFDNAFGLTEGTDLRANGVRVGSVDKLDVDPETARAVVTVAVEDTSFGDLRDDAECSIEPQSLIGEYFVDCQPGTSEERLAEGGQIPVEQTTITIPPDLVNNIMRRPWRERFGIILAELGQGLAARGPELQETIRRALPALRETDRVLTILADNRRRLRELSRASDVVLGRLAERRDDVAKFVVEARDTAAATADRREDLETDLQLLPPFLRELRPTLAELGTTVRLQTPALRNLRAAADDLELVFGRLGPFSEASETALRSLGDVAGSSIDDVRALRPTARELAGLGRVSGDPMNNLRRILEHLDDRDFAVEPNRESPGGKGFTGLEAFLQYPFVQSQAINIFDSRGYLLKLNALPSQCSAYANAKTVREDPELREACNADLGPGPALGIDYDLNNPDERRSARTRRSADGPDAPRERPAREDSAQPRDQRPSGGGGNSPVDRLPIPQSLRDILEGATQPPKVPGVDPPALPRDQGDALLDFLFAP